MTDYVWLKPVDDGTCARFGLIENYDDSWELDEGDPLAESFPRDARYAMDPDYKQRTALYDALNVLGYQIVVGERLRGLLEARNVSGIEYLPVGVVDHKKKPVAPRYFLAHLLDLVDCVDRKRTKYKPNALDPDEMTSVSNLTLEAAKLPKGRELFRVKGLPPLIVATRGLVDYLAAAKVTGFEPHELAGFTW